MNKTEMSSEAERKEAAWGQWRFAWQLARRELRSGFKGFYVFMACLALGVAAIAAVGSVSASVFSSLSADAQKLLGGDVDIRIIYQEASPDMVKKMTSAGRVSRSIEMRSMAHGPEEETGEETSRRRLVEVKAVEMNYPLYGQLEITPQISVQEALKKRTNKLGQQIWGAAVDPRLPTLLGVALGDQIQIGNNVYEIRAFLDKEPDRGGNPFGFGPRVIVAYDSMAASGLLRLGSLYHYHYKIALKETTDLTQFRQELIKEFPDAGWRIHDTRNASPGIKNFVDRITLFLTLVGLTSLLVGGVGVSHAVHTYLQSKTNIIATLKCVGAASGLIQKIYGLQIAVLASIAIAIGLIIGVFTPLLGVTLFGDILPVTLKPELHIQPLVIASLFGALTAFTFSLWPLLRAREVAPAALFRDFIQPTKLYAPWQIGRRQGKSSSGRETSKAAHNQNDSGMTDATGGNYTQANDSVFRGPRWRWGDALLLSLGVMGLMALAIGSATNPVLAIGFILSALFAMVIFHGTARFMMLCARQLSNKPKLLKGRPEGRFALASLHRPGAVTAGVVMSLGLGLTVLVAIASIQGNLTQQVSESLPGQAPTFYLINLQPDQVPELETLVADMEEVGDLLTTPMIRGRITKIKGIPAEKAQIDPDVAWALRGDRGMTYASTPPVGTSLAQGTWWQADYQGPPKISLDDNLAKGFGLELGDELTLNILGRNVEVQLANSRTIDWTSLSMNFSVIFAPGFLEKAPHSFIATVKATSLEAEDQLFKSITDRFPNVSVIPVRQALESVQDVMEHIALAVRVTAAVTLLAGILVLAGAIAAGHQRRVRDAVLLKVLGATRWRVLGIFLLEYGLLALITAAIATGMGSLASWVIVTEVMSLSWGLVLESILSTIVLCVVITLVAGLLGTWRALGQKAAPLLRNE